MKAKKIEVFYDKYFTTIVYEYRGCKYEVTYGNGWQVCVTPSWIQHRNAQADIDEMLDNPKPIKKSENKPAQEVLNDLWEMMGW